MDTLSREVGKVIVGQRHLIDTLLIGLLSNGHILLEGVPGLAKTLAITTLAKAVDARKGRKLTAGLCAAMVPVVGAISYILPLFVVKIGPWADEIGPAWLAKLDSLLTCRISLAWAASGCST